LLKSSSTSGNNCVLTQELLTVEQAAEKLQMHVGTIRRLLRDKRLPGVKIGLRQWRISADALKQFVEKGGK
jgi:excisionase family DNA binding protein